MMDTINYYCEYGKSQMAEHPYLIELTAKMAEIALFTQNNNQTINNSEGAILFQLLFQTFKGTTALDGAHAHILDIVRTRMAGDF